MTCYKPLIRVEFQNQIKTAKDGHIYKAAKILKADEYEKFQKINDDLVKIQRIPCGKCIGCRLDYSKQWALRCLSESKTSSSSWFITLTYDEEHLQIPESKKNEKTGETFYNDGTWKGTLVPKDMTKFIKDLRRYWDYHYNIKNIRFFYCGEYGGETQRPHYHLLVFNLPIEQTDLEYKFSNKNYDPIYISPKIEKIWGKGLISIGAVTFSSCAYVARYITKKQYGDVAYNNYCKKGQIPEYVRMSRKPGIGFTYLADNCDEIYETDEIFATTCKGTSLRTKPPHYFDKKLEEIDPDRMEKVKDLRKAKAEKTESNQMKQTSLKIKNQMYIKEKTQATKLTSLPRNL